MKRSLSTCLLLVAALACNRKMSATAQADAANTAGIPSCIQQKIDSLKTLHVFNPPAEIHEYEYDGRKVYLVSADCCDMFISLYDENCHYICAPSGGFTGKGDGKCTDFNEQAKHLRLVWKDSRKRN